MHPRYILAAAIFTVGGRRGVLSTPYCRWGDRPPSPSTLSAPRALASRAAVRRTIDMYLAAATEGARVSFSPSVAPPCGLGGSDRPATARPIRRSADV
eukprot:scaffold19457_cov140-Isochrysis_galbana.AAC.3